MHRILFPLILLLCGNVAAGQVPAADSLLKKLSLDPSHSDRYFQQLKEEMQMYNGVEFKARILHTGKIIEKNLDGRVQVQAYRFLGEACWSKQLYAEAIGYYDKSIGEASGKGLTIEAGTGHLHVAAKFMENEMYPQALERVYKANEFFVKAHDLLKQAKARSTAASISYHAANYFLAIEEIEKSLALFRTIRSLSHGDSTDMMSALNTCGLSYSKMGNTRKAMDCFSKAEEFATLLNNKFWKGLINGNKSAVYAQLGETDQAIRCLLIDLKSSKAFKEWGSAMGSCLSLSELFIRKNDWLLARQYLDTANQFMKRYGSTLPQQERYLKSLSKLLSHEKKDNEAYRMLLRRDFIIDSLQSGHTATALARIKTAYEIQQKQSQIEMLTARNEFRGQQIAYRNIVVGCAVVTIILLFILAFVIYRNYKIKKEDNYLLIERNNEIRAINEELRASTETLSSQNQIIQKLNEDLELKVKRRTHQLEEANAELDMFLYRASHDIRRPITTLLGLGNLAHVTFQDANATILFDKVTETATHMDRMLHKLQMIYALNRPHDASTQIPLVKAIQNSVEKFSAEMNNIGMDCSINLGEHTSFKGDESLLSIVFQNLIENAITFRKSDELEKPHLRIDAVEKDGHVVVSVSDNGVGIESDYQEKIFDLHFRGTALSHGNGLGLYLVRKALALLKGRIDVSSEFGKGSTFSLYFYSD